MRCLPYSATAAALLAALLVGLASSDALAQATQSASASVRIQVIVQPYVHIQRNQHPAFLISADGATSAEQQLHIRTNQPHGFCLDLNPAQPGTRLQWDLQVVAGDSVTVSPVGPGYRICGDRPGVYQLTLIHRFQHTPQPTPWPVFAALANP